MTAKQRQELVDDLQAVAKKHNVSISGCGCCGSPSLDSEGEDGKCLAERIGIYPDHVGIVWFGTPDPEPKEWSIK